MKPIEENKRNSAAQEFEQSLEQLEDIVKPLSSHDQKLPKPEIMNTVKTQNSEEIDKIDLGDLAAWEDAVADIEQYLGEKFEEETEES